MTNMWSNIMGHEVGQMDYPGIYQVRMVDSKGKPVAIDRIGGVDEEGLIYVGFSNNVGERIKEFHSTLSLKGKHDGASTYFLMRQNLVSLGHDYASCKLQCTVTRLPGTSETELRKQEAIMLANYFSKYSELPPCNCNFPEKWGEFTHQLQQFWGWST
jgi:hypothetical protein